ncbi:leucine-rich repeat-containing protein 66 [Oryzias latipes]|uniref:Immunoglobulin domain-containing protein n=1 Tax=Oryzias latipes TaxID=8090 RepID=A0A3B3I5K5_ORYLA|nr:leucine-rich repeat-containing protein 66 [Oryzias latipes]
MAAVRAALLAAALLFALPGSSSSPFCPESCSCQRASLLNCSSSGLISVPQLIPDSFSELDFSHNYLSSVKPRQPHQNLRKLWLGNNTISRLSLCVERNVKTWHRSRNGSRRGCQAWAPNLQTLSLERNQLERLPEGLGVVPSLRVLWLAFNKISVLQLGELRDLQQLEELHLQHNLITHLHPQMFQDLIQLRVLDLRFNLLTVFHPLMYLTLRNIGANVGLDGNRWRCDCNMRSLRRRMAYDNSRGLEVWKMMCASPTKLLGTDFLQLKEEDLQCLSPENSADLHQDVTVYSGSQILLSCSSQDSMWWMPGVPAPMRPKDGGLLITDISEKNTGLYVCVSAEQQVVSVFNLQISQIESPAKTRNLARTRRETTPQSRATRTQSNLTLAVCLSVIITFLVAFILGVLARPYIDLLWKRITRKGSSASNSVSSVEQRHYENAAFSNSDEAAVGGPYRERRVTFRNEDDRENRNVPYYDTVGSDQNSVASDEVFAAVGPNTQAPGCEQGMQQQNAPVRHNDASAETTAMQNHQVEFEHIPDPDELETKSLSSSSSESSLSENVEQITKRCHTTPKSPLLEKETIHKRASFPGAKEVQNPQMSIEFPEFSSEPFADWSPHSNKGNSKDDEELFDFSDSPQSTPARSNSGFANTLDKKNGDTSSSSSSDSEEESTQDTLNTNQGRHGSKLKSSALKQSRHTSSSDDSTDQETKLTKSKRLRNKWPSIALGQNEIQALSPAFSTSSSCDSEDETIHHTKSRRLGTLEMRPICEESDTKRYKPNGFWPTIDVQTIPRIRRRLDFVKSSSRNRETFGHNFWHITQTKVEQGEIISLSDSSTRSKRQEKRSGKIRTSLKKTHKPMFHTSPHVKAPSQSSSSSSSSDSDDEIEVQIKPHEQKKVQVSTPQQIKDPPGSSSSTSSESEDDTESHRVIQRAESWKTGQLPILIPQSKDYEPPSRWPIVDLLHVPHIKRRLDFKVPSSHSASSSSSNNSDRTSLKKTDKPMFHTSTSPHVKAPSQSSSSSSSSDSDDDINVQIKPHEQKKVPVSTPQQIKDPPGSSSSTSSESEDDTESHRDIQRAESWKTGQLPILIPQSKDYDPPSRWPIVDLLHVPHIKRRLDFKVPSSHSASSSSSNNSDRTSLKKTDKPMFHTSTSPHVKAPSQSSSSSSSSDSDDDIKVQIKPHEQNKVLVSTPQQIRDPPGSSSSTSSESEDDTESHRDIQRAESWKTGQLPILIPQSKDYDPPSRWPIVDLLHVPHIKRRLDFKVPSSRSASSSSSNNSDRTSLKKTDKPMFHTSTSPHVKAPSQSSSSSSSSDSDDDIKVQIKPHEQNKVLVSTPQQIKDPPGSSSSTSSESEDDTESHRDIQRAESWKTGQLPILIPQSKDYEPPSRWPIVDLLHVPHIKRRLDFKVPSSRSASSSSSNNSDRTSLKKTDKPMFHTSTSPHVKAPSQSSSSSSSSDSDDDIKVQIKPHEQNKVLVSTPQQIRDPPGSSSSTSSESEDDTESHRDIQRAESWKTGQLPILIPQSKDYDPPSRWPIVDLLHVPHIKRRLDFKVPSSHSASSSSSNNSDRTSLKKTDKPMFHTSTSPHVKAPSQSSSSSSSSDSDDDIKVQIKPHEQNKVLVSTPQQIRDPPGSSSSTSSESEDDTESHRDIQRAESWKTGQLPILIPQSKDYDPPSRWPIVDLLHVPHIKRRLDFKVPSSRSASSSSSNNSDRTSLKKTDKPMFHTSTSPHVKAPSQSSSSSSSSDSDDDIKVQIKPHEQKKVQVSTPQQIKDPPGSSSSTSSESEDDTESHRVIQRAESWKTGQLPILIPQSKDYDPPSRWPIVDLLHVPHIKRRLDFKVPSSHSASSSSSNNSDRTSLKKTDKPMFHTSTSPHVKAPSQSSSSSSSSDSDDDIKVQIKPHEQNKVLVSTPQQIRDPPGSSSSTSSESEDDTESHRDIQRAESWKTGQLPILIPQSKDYEPPSRWPIVDLLHVPHIKRRLDFKVPSSRSASSSSSNNSDRTSLKKTDKPMFHTSTSPHVKAPSQSSSSSSSSDSDDDIKVQIKPHEQKKVQVSTTQQIKDPPGSSSSTSSESEDDTESHRVIQRAESWKTGQLPILIPQSKDYEPPSRWPIVDLLHVPHIKRRLDFKVPSSRSASSSSSNNSDRTSLKKTDKPMFHTSTSPHVKAPSQSSSSSSSSDSDDDIKVQIKPHEQKKVQVSTTQQIKDPPGSSSSTSSESEDDTESHRVIQRAESWKTGQLPILIPQSKDYDPPSRWPIVDLLHVPHIKRRLDFKVPSSHSASSSSSNNSDRTSLKKTDKPMFHTSTSPHVKAPSQSSSSSSSSDSDDDIKVQIKPHEQNKVLVSTPQQIRDPPGSSSSTSSESEDDTESHRDIQRAESWKTGQLPILIPQSKDYEPPSRWPIVDLLHVPHIKRRLDFKVPSSRSASSSSSNNSDRTSLKKTDKPMFHTSTSPHVKAPSQSSSSSSSSDSDDEIKVQIKPHKTPPRSSNLKEEKKFRVKSSAMNIHSPPKNTPKILLEKYVTFEDDVEYQPTKDTIYTSTEPNQDFHRRWATMNLGISRFRKHLEISSQTAPRPNLISPTPYTPSSEIRFGIGASLMSHIGIQELTHTDPSPVPETKPNNLRTTLRNSQDKLSTAVQNRAAEYNFQTKGKTSKSESILADFAVGTSEKDQGSLSSSEEETKKSNIPDLSLGVPRIKRRLNLKVLSPKMSSSSPSSSENEGDSSSKLKNTRHAPNVLSLADDPVFSYKRSIIKSSLYTKPRSQAMDAMSSDMVTAVHEGTGLERNYVAPWSHPHLSFDDIVKKRSEELKLDTDVPLPPMRQTGAGHGIPSLFINKERNVKASLHLIPPENLTSPPCESNEKVAEILQDNRKPVTLGLEYSSPGPVNDSSSFTSNPETFGSFSDGTNEALKSVFEDKTERRGFSALAAMSLARRQWDTDLDRDESLSSDDHILQDRGHFLYSRNETDRVLSEPQSPSASENDKRVLDLLYGVPSYRSHGFRNIKPPQEAPPPVP